VTLRRAGSQQVTVRDTNNNTFTATVTTLVSAADLSGFAMTGFPSPVRAGSVNTFTVRAIDTFGNTVPDYQGTIQFDSTDAQAVVPEDYTFTGDDHGSHMFAAVLKTAGVQQLIVTDSTTSDLTGSQSITVTPAALDHFLVRGFASPTVAGSVHTLEVSARDAYDNILPSYRGTVHFTSSDPHATLPDDYTFTADDNGSRTFGAILQTAGTRSITANQVGGSVNGTQSGIVVAPAAASYFVLFAPGAVGADEDFEVTLRVFDRYGNIATGYAGTVAFSTSDADGTIPASHTFTAADAGEYVFHVTLHQPGQQSITALDDAGLSNTVFVVVS
jgi:hypothetical protein